ncbi:MAG: NAD(P)/FAD-dependent oxidoreductase [Acidimicrobiales bacterium]
MRERSSLVDAAPVSFWLDDPGAPPPAAALVGRTSADLTVIGGGYTGLWSALAAKERGPDRDVVLLESDRCGWAASGRNGGFCASSVTHGLENGLAHFPDEIETLERLGRENLDAIEADLSRLGIDCDFERTGELSVATAPHQALDLREAAQLATRYGRNVTYLDGEAVRCEVDSPTYLAGLWDRDGCALVNPARLAWGLRRACERAGVRIYENTPVDSLTMEGNGAALRTRHGTVASAKVVVATNAFPSPVRKLSRYIVPVYDYVLMTEPLSSSQLDSIGWRNRQGIGGSGNQFLYYRLTRDGRVLFGGYDAVYYFASRMQPALEQRDRTFSRLVTLFDETFPQLDKVRFTHAWAGAIDTCSRFCVFFDRSFGGRVVSAAGFTGLGVGASRFAARVMLDLLSGDDTELTRLGLVRHKPVPFPPEPLRSVGIQLTRWSLGRADRHGGRRNIWLRTLDRAGMGFDS